MPVDVTIPSLPLQATAPLLTDCTLMVSDPDGTPAVKRVSFGLISALAQSVIAATQSASPLFANGQYYIWTPRSGQSNSIIGQWQAAPFIFQCIDNSKYYASFLRLADNLVDVLIEWRLVSWTCQNPDNNLYYTWTPYVAQDGVTINGKWTLTSTVAAGVAQINPDNNISYLWTPRLGQDGVTIIGQWV